MRLLVALLLGGATLAWAAEPADDLKACEARAWSVATQLGTLRQDVEALRRVRDYYALQLAQATTELVAAQARAGSPTIPTPTPTEPPK